MIKNNFHTHTNFGDGAHSPEEMVLSAIDLGMVALGFSEHSPRWIDEVYGSTEEKIAQYWEEITRLRDKYRDKIRIYRGIEQDGFSPKLPYDYDYQIGSTHYVCKDGHWVACDDCKENIHYAIDNYYGGDALALAEDYFEEESHIIEKTDAEIIGHFDLISKNVEKDPFLDTNHPRYRAAWQKAADALLKTGRVFEINTGAISRQWRYSPYPAPEIMMYLRDRGARFVLGADVHHKDYILCKFDYCENLCRELGLHLVDFEDVMKEKK